jgi:SAM-dependent methyltransferase
MPSSSLSADKKFLSRESAPAVNPDVAPAYITDEGILVTNPNSVVVAPNDVNLILPHQWTLRQNAYDEGRVESRGNEGGSVLHRLPHAELYKAGIATTRDPGVYLSELSLSPELVARGWAKDDLVAAEELATYLLLVNIFGLDFPGYEQPNSTYQSEYSINYHFEETVRALQDFINRHPQSAQTKILEIGGQEGRTARELLTLFKEKTTLDIDIVDKFVVGRLHSNNPARNFLPVPHLRIIQGDAMNLPRVSQSLVKGDWEPLAYGKYDVCLLLNVLDVAFDSAQLLRQAWDSLADDGEIYIERPHSISFQVAGNDQEIGESNRESVTWLRDQLRSVPSVQQFTTEDWRNLAQCLPGLHGSRHGASISLTEFLDQQGIAYDLRPPQSAAIGIIVIHKNGVRNPFNSLQATSIGAINYHGDQGSYLLKAVSQVKA